MKVSEYLHRGAGAPVRLAELAALAEMPEREVRRCIERERRSGVPICSDNRSGYFLASSEEERDRFIRSMVHRAVQILITVRAVQGGDIQT